MLCGVRRGTWHGVEPVETRGRSELKVEPSRRNIWFPVDFAYPAMKSPSYVGSNDNP